MFHTHCSIFLNFHLCKYIYKSIRKFVTSGTVTNYVLLSSLGSPSWSDIIFLDNWTWISHSWCSSSRSRGLTYHSDPSRIMLRKPSKRRKDQILHYRVWKRYSRPYRRNTTTMIHMPIVRYFGNFICVNISKSHQENLPVLTSGSVTNYLLLSSLGTPSWSDIVFLDMLIWISHS